MPRAKKDGIYLNVRVETPIYKKLQEVCEEAGQFKTTVVERALAAYFEEYDRKQEILRKFENDE
ncbi:MAG: hypothetical protein SO267_03025 [Lachnospiraceae bacterium]|nr:hypothetical protein [Lachnospiraceae bacterium]